MTAILQCLFNVLHGTRFRSALNVCNSIRKIYFVVVFRRIEDVEEGGGVRAWMCCHFFY